MVREETVVETNFENTWRSPRNISEV